MGEEDPYAVPSKGKLKLKCDSGIKKKKKHKDKKLIEKVSKAVEAEADEHIPVQNQQKKTKAELAFIQQQETMVRNKHIFVFFCAVSWLIFDVMTY